MIFPVIYEITIPKNNTTDIELINLKGVNDNNKKENEVVITEVKIAMSESLFPLNLNME